MPTVTFYRKEEKRGRSKGVPFENLRTIRDQVFPVSIKEGVYLNPFPCIENVGETSQGSVVLEFYENAARLERGGELPFTIEDGTNIPANNCRISFHEMKVKRLPKLRSLNLTMKFRFQFFVDGNLVMVSEPFVVVSRLPKENSQLDPMYPFANPVLYNDTIIFPLQQMEHLRESAPSTTVHIDSMSSRDVSPELSPLIPNGIYNIIY